VRLDFPKRLDARVIVRDLERAFDEENEAKLAMAYLRLSEFYRLPFPPAVVLVERIHSKPMWAGATSEKGRIELIRPDRWKRNRKHNSRERWVEVALHEFAHYLLHSHPEPRADWFAGEILHRANRRAAKGD